MEIEEFTKKLKERKYCKSVADSGNHLEVVFSVTIHGRVKVVCEMLIDKSEVRDSMGAIIHKFLFDVYGRLMVSLVEFRNEWCKKKMHDRISAIMNEIGELQNSEIEPKASFVAVSRNSAGRTAVIK